MSIEIQELLEEMEGKDQEIADLRARLGAALADLKTATDGRWAMEESYKGACARAEELDRRKRHVAEQADRLMHERDAALARAEKVEAERALDRAAFEDLVKDLEKRAEQAERDINAEVAALCRSTLASAEAQANVALDRAEKAEAALREIAEHDFYTMAGYPPAECLRDIARAALGEGPRG
jgi:hypothetical protein